MDALPISYQEIGCQIEINKKGQIQDVGFTPFGWDMIWKSHWFEPVDMLVFIAVIWNSIHRSAILDIFECYKELVLCLWFKDGGLSVSRGHSGCFWLKTGLRY